MPGKAAKVRVTEKQLVVIEEFSRSRSVSRAVIQRATVVLRAFQGMRNEDIAPQVGLNRQQVGVWRQRWRDAWEALCVWECREPRRLREAIQNLFKDAPGRGAPAKFTPEQVTAIIAVACEPPSLSGRPITQWTHRELRDEVMQRNIVDNISVTQVGRFLKRASAQPHRTKIWLNTKEKDPVQFQAAVETVCQTYLEAPAKFETHGTHTVSVDEKTSIQALERTAPDKPTHGTTTLTAGLDVVTGQIIAPTLEPTRTEPEFVQHIARTVALDPAAEWIFVVDRLNTHVSESLVKFVADACDLDLDLGKKSVWSAEVDVQSN